MRKKIDLIVLLLVLVGGYFALNNAVAIGDWWHFMGYDPPIEIEQIAEEAGMSEQGKRLFYRFSPELVSKEKLDQLCTADKLGCVEGQSMYILDHTSKKEYQRSVVTASHEMLHIAWSRLSEDEIKVLEPILERELSLPHASKVALKIEGYPPEEQINEAHSFIGSELRNISDELENHYHQYFTDRNKTTTINIFSAH